MAADKIYQKCGQQGKTIDLVRRDRNHIAVMQITFYKSKKEYNKILKKVDKKTTIHVLHQACLSLMITKGRYAEDDFEWYR